MSEVTIRCDGARPLECETNRILRSNSAMTTEWTQRANSIIDPRSITHATAVRPQASPTVTVTQTTSAVTHVTLNASAWSVPLRRHRLGRYTRIRITPHPDTDAMSGMTPTHQLLGTGSPARTPLHSESTIGYIANLSCPPPPWMVDRSLPNAALRAGGPHAPTGRTPCWTMAACRF